MNDPVLSRLGIARKAGKLSLGTEVVKTALQKNISKLVLVSYEISSKTEKELRFKSNGISVMRIPYTIFNISNAVGVKAGIVSVNDNGFAEAIKNQLLLIPETEEN